ncbi:MAG: DUF1232 domain-containing protein [Thermoplasmata archaeon]|nr:DUF1232 domain-containing protein [Thermoplasmata archaeon]
MIAKSTFKERSRLLKSRMIGLKWDILALYLARKDPAVPLRTRIIIAIAVGYVLSPIDLIPDFIPVIGYLDDIIIVPALVSWAIRTLPPELMDNYRKLAKVEFAKGSPKAWEAAFIIVSFWIIVLGLFGIWLWKIIV